MFDNVDTHGGLDRLVERENLYEDVMKMYRENLEELLEEFPFRISFKMERAVDTGGVCRDFFSAFWEEAYVKHFDGERLLVPAVHANTNLASLPLLGTILVHGFMVCGYLPVRIAFPIIAAIVCGPNVQINEDTLLESFVDYLSTHDSSILKEALEQRTLTKFIESMQTKLINMLSPLGCREIPIPSKIREIIQTIAHHEFIIKPLGILYAMRSGVPEEYHGFWNKFSIQKIFELYKALNANTSVVLAMIQEPDTMNAAEDRVFRYLKALIGNMKQHELTRFLRFMTGSSVLINEGIKVVFNNLTGAARRPISHTCSCSLELSLSYTTFPEFEAEFTKVLLDDGFCWVMDAI